MSIIGSVKVNSHPVAEILRRKGLDMNGDVQQFHTANVLRRIVRYMPYRTGATIKLTQAQSPISRPEINSFVPYARYLHEGKVMVNAVTGNGPMLIPGIGPRWRRGTQLESDRAAVEVYRGKESGCRAVLGTAPSGKGRRCHADGSEELRSGEA